jgi:hypothetical protein
MKFAALEESKQSLPHSGSPTIRPWCRPVNEQCYKELEKHDVTAVLITTFTELSFKKHHSNIVNINSLNFMPLSNVGNLLVLCPCYNTRPSSHSNTRQHEISLVENFLLECSLSSVALWCMWQFFKISRMPMHHMICCGTLLATTILRKMAGLTAMPEMEVL